MSSAPKPASRLAKRKNSSASHADDTFASSGNGGKAARRRKVPKLSELEAELAALEKENLDLRLQLKLGVEVSERIANEKQQILKKMDTLIKSKASEREVDAIILEYVNKFSDYGENRAKCYARHMKQLENLLNPTQITKMCIWALHQEDDFFSASNASQQSLALGDSSSNVTNGGNTNIWSIVCDLIGATAEQKEKIKCHMDDAKKLAKDLRSTIRECQDLKQRMERKNTALTEEMIELRRILTPIQLAKFILWVNENKASIAMLDKLWNPADELHSVHQL